MAPGRRQACSHANLQPSISPHGEELGYKRISRACRKAATTPSSRALKDDAAIAILPADAYALLLLFDADLYEDEDDDFCCGRAYGGSRVAVVSTARYNPLLVLHGGGEQRPGDVDLAHVWSASHCAAYVSSQCGIPKERAPKRRRKGSPSVQGEGGDVAGSALPRAVAAFNGSPSMSSPEAMRGLWLFCVARTAAHELGHCFGMAHCVYYACAMQGTASVALRL